MTTKNIMHLNLKSKTKNIYKSILSKKDAAPAQYAALAKKGFFVRVNLRI